MKKFLILFFALLAISCSKDEETTVQEDTRAEIVKLYQVRLRRENPIWAYNAYVMRLSDGKDMYMLRWKSGVDLHEGDKIDYRSSHFCANEISRLNGYELQTPGADDTEADTKSSKSLIASDPIEADVTDIFEMDMIYAVPLLPIASYAIELEGRELIICQKAKIQTGIQPGDRIVYNVYTLFPNEVLMLKKLR